MKFKVLKIDTINTEEIENEVNKFMDKYPNTFIIQIERDDDIFETYVYCLVRK